MSGGISATTVLAAAAATSAVASIYGATQKPKTPAAAAVPAPEKPPQASKAPETGALRRQNATAEGGPGMSGSATLLTGPGGVDPSLLNLGKSTLLGQ